MILATASALPPAYEEALSKPEVVSLVVGFIIAILAALTALATLAKKWADRKLEPLRDDVAAVRYQAENNHGPDGKNDNMREQIDRIEHGMAEGFRRMDHQFGEVHDRQTQQDRRIEGVENRASEEHAHIWKALEN
jgi:hypothetical protein